jgi:hypothetical protein
MNDEWVKIRKEAVIAYLKLLSCIRFGGSDEGTRKNIGQGIL